MFRKIHTFRVRPGQELLTAIGAYCRQRKLLSGIVLNIIGSASRARLNYIDKLPGIFQSVDYTGPLEIVAAQGSVALKDSNQVLHIHIQLCDRQGCYGGHLVEAQIFSTAEVVIGELDHQLYREFDEYTGLNELAGA